VAPRIELLYWHGCPSHPRALTELRKVLQELGHSDLDVELTEIATPAQAQQRHFVGSPTLRVDGVDPLPPADEPAGLTCRVYRRRDGRHSPTPDPEQLREALRRLLPPPTEEI
jgi:hypothetical protein